MQEKIAPFRLRRPLFPIILAPMDTSDILLHCCCAVCASSCVERLLGEGRRVTLFFSNANIAPPAEFERRLEAMRKLAAIHDLPLYVDPPDHAAWLAHIAGYENEPERGARCPRCFGFSLARAAAKAAELGIGAFTTSLTVSPHKDSRTIFACGAAFPGFEAHDFKKKDGFLRSNQLARQYGLYRQCYCGCEFSAAASSAASASSSAER